MRGSLRILWLFILAAGVVMPGPVRAGAEIFSITPETGPAGTEVQIKGRGLKRTRHVLFAVGGTARTARFQVVSDDELKVVVPEYYRPGAAATVAVIGPTGLAIAVPATVQTIRRGDYGRNGKEPGAGFYHVLTGGRVRSAESVALIEPGGVVDRSRAPAMQLVKRGGVLMEFSNPNGIVFAERGAILGSKLFDPRDTPARRFIPVQKITSSPGVGPFVYQGVPRPDAARIVARPPHIEAVVPAAAAAGDIVSLRGRGFTRTTEVRFIHNDGKSRTAGFRIVSDQQLKVEVPDKDALSGAQLVMVVTTEGLTVTLPRRGMLRPWQILAQPTRRIPRDAILWLGEGDVLATADENRVVFITAGGQLGAGRPGATFFVQRDGALAADRNGAPLWNGGTAGSLGKALAQRGEGGVFYEPGAILPEEFRKAPLGHATPAIVPSFFDREFVILPGPLFRP